MNSEIEILSFLPAKDGVCNFEVKHRGSQILGKFKIEKDRIRFYRFKGFESKEDTQWEKVAVIDLLNENVWGSPQNLEMAQSLISYFVHDGTVRH